MEFVIGGAYRAKKQFVCVNGGGNRRAAVSL